MEPCQAHGPWGTSPQRCSSWSRCATLLKFTYFTSGDGLLSLTVYCRSPNIPEAVLRGSQPSPICLTLLWLWRQRLATKNRCPLGSYERSQFLNENCTWYLLYLLYLWGASLWGIWWILWQNSVFKTCQQWEQELWVTYMKWICTAHSPRLRVPHPQVQPTVVRNFLKNGSVWIRPNLQMFFSLPVLSS